MYQVTLRRVYSQKRDQRTGLDHIAERAVGGNRAAWKLESLRCAEPNFVDGKWIYTCTMVFEKFRGRLGNKDLLDREWQRIVEMIAQLGEAQRFGPYPWKIVNAANLNEHPNVAPDERQAEAEEELTPEEARKLVAHHAVQIVPVAAGVRHAIYDDEVPTLDILRGRCAAIIDDLLEHDDRLSQHETFNKIFGRNAQIRTILSSIKSFFETSGQRRNHALLYGLPACAKTQILSSITNLLGQDAVLRLDATSTSSAGIYKLFFDELDVVPPIVVIEEIEKTNEEALRVWLGALDDRGELRKVNYREMKVREVRILCLATANDKEAFDNLMKKTASNQPGALSSRFVHQLECPRPDRFILKKILLRDIHQNGGKEVWVEPVLRLAEAIGTNDPRKVLAFLDGGDRLLNGEYQRDILDIYHKSELFDELFQGDVERLDKVVQKLEVEAEVEAA